MCILLTKNKYIQIFTGWMLNFRLLTWSWLVKFQSQPLMWTQLHTILTPIKMFNRHPYHLVEYRPWPLTGSIGAFVLVVGLTRWFHGYGTTPLLIGLIIILATIIQWWRDIVREGTFIGHHTSYVVKGLRWGIILFIASEVLFFTAFFWAFFHRRLAPNAELGCSWPPSGVTPLNPFSVPLLNTRVLLASGISITWAHQGFFGEFKCNVVAGLIVTVALGFYFTFLQATEYLDTAFSLSDRAYGTTFFVATGFHGLHVLIGSTFLFICLLRIYYNQFSLSHHFGFEAAAWYWHFVDVVWLFLFVFLYWWAV